MLKLKPIPENEADDEINALYVSVKKTLNVSNVPLIFQYLARFPVYFSYIWNQARMNLTDTGFIKNTNEISFFSQEAINQIYTPSETTKLFLDKIKGRAELSELKKFCDSSSAVNSSLYLLSLAIRESIKGVYLGIKQIGEKLDEDEKAVFNNFADGFSFKEESYMEKTMNKIASTSDQLANTQKGSIVTSVYGEFFKFIDWEMKRLLKMEEYLTRRVELERFSLNLLHFMPHPLDSSFTNIIKQTSHDPTFPELIYLVADLFPTQTPYKLMASSVMKKALFYKSENQEENPSDSVLLHKTK